MLGELLGAGVSLLGGLLGGKKKTQTTESTVNYEKMAAKASAAGFNPLTAIRNGGSAGFTSTSTPTISNTPEILANLGGVLGQSLGDKLDPINAKKREIDTLLVDRQLAQLKEGPQVPGRFMTPRTFQGTKVSQQLVPRLGATSHKQTASVPGAFIGPPSPKQYVKDNGGMDLYVPTWDRFYNKVHWTANPDLPDLDQMAVPTVTAVGNEAVQAVNKAKNYDFKPGWLSPNRNPKTGWKPRSSFPGNPLRPTPQGGKYQYRGK